MAVVLDCPRLACRLPSQGTKAILQDQLWLSKPGGIHIKKTLCDHLPDIPWITSAKLQDPPRCHGLWTGRQSLSYRHQSCRQLQGSGPREGNTEQCWGRSNVLFVAYGRNKLNKLKSLKCFHALSQIQEISTIMVGDADSMHSQGQILSWEEATDSHL